MVACEAVLQSKWPRRIPETATLGPWVVSSLLQVLVVILRQLIVLVEPSLFAQYFHGQLLGHQLPQLFFVWCISSFRSLALQAALSSQLSYLCRRLTCRGRVELQDPGLLRFLPSPELVLLITPALFWK